MMIFIRGDSFSKIAEYRDDCDQLIDLTNSDVIASIKTPDQLWSQNLTITILDQGMNQGKFLISSTDTSSWRVGEMILRISRIQDGAKSSAFIKFRIVEG